MIALLPALSLSNKLIEVGALAAFAALVGIAILSLLVFSQARELKRLREWAGRAPERAAELDQRVAAEAAMRAQRPAQPVVPRATPMIARQVAGQPPALTAAGQPAAPVPGQPAPGQPAPNATPAPTVAPLPTPVPGQPAFVPTAQTVAGAAQAGVESAPAEGSKPEGEPTPAEGGMSEGAPTPVEGAMPEGAPTPVEGTMPEEVQPELPAPAAEEEAPRPAPAPDAPEPVAAEAEPAPAQELPAAEELQPPEAEPAVAAAAGSGALAPATVAAAAASTAVASRVVETAQPAALPRAPVPPAAPAKAGVPPAPAGVSSKPLPPRPPAPVGPRPTAPRAAQAGSVRALGRDGGAPPKFLVEEEPSSRKTVALIAGGVVVGVVVLAAILLSGGSGSNSPGTGTAGRSTANGGRHGHVAVATPAETHVIVLNATEAEGLAHKLAGNLRQSGYGLALASSAKPPSARSTSVVEYASGHRTEAQHVGQTLGIGEVTPIEGAVAAVVNGTSVVVIAGADKESLVGSATEAAPTEAAPGEAEAGGGSGEAQAGAAQGNEAAANAG